MAVIARTESVYETPTLNENFCERAVAGNTLDHAGLPVLETLYPVIGEPPFDAGGVHDIVADFVALAPTIFKFRGAVNGDTAGIVNCTVATGPTPMALIAATDRWYDTPGAKVKVCARAVAATVLDQPAPTSRETR